MPVEGGREYATYYTRDMCPPQRRKVYGRRTARNATDDVTDVADAAPPPTTLYLTARFGSVPGAFRHVLEPHVGCVLRSGVFGYDLDRIRSYDDVPTCLLDDGRWDRHLRFRDGMPCDDSSRGGGYWFWKFAIIRHHLEEMPEGGVLIYTDPDRLEFLDGVGKIVSAMEERGHDLAAEQFYPYYCSNCGPKGDNEPGREGDWTKGDLFERFGVCRRFAAAGAGTDVSPQYCGNFLAVRKTADAVGFVNELVGTVSDYHLLSDEASVAPNFPGFVENRHDQSVLSMTIKYGDGDGKEKVKLDVPYLRDWTLYTFKL